MRESRGGGHRIETDPASPYYALATGRRSASATTCPATTSGGAAAGRGGAERGVPAAGAHVRRCRPGHGPGRAGQAVEGAGVRARGTQRSPSPVISAGCRRPSWPTRRPGRSRPRGASSTRPAANSSRCSTCAGRRRPRPVEHHRAHASCWHGYASKRATPPAPWNWPTRRERCWPPCRTAPRRSGRGWPNSTALGIARAGNREAHTTEPLTEREVAVLRLLGGTLSLREIGTRAVRVGEHGQDAHPGDLPQARRLHPARRRRAGKRLGI